MTDSERQAFIVGVYARVNKRTPNRERYWWFDGFDVMDKELRPLEAELEEKKQLIAAEFVKTVQEAA